MGTKRKVSLDELKSIISERKERDVIDLKNCDFTGMNLIEMNLNDIDFTGSTFQYCRMNYATFKNSNLSQCDLDNVFMMHTDFTNADLSFARMTNSVACSAKMNNVMLRGVETHHTNFCRAMFRCASIKDCSMHFCDFQYTDFYGATIVDTKLVECNFITSNARLSRIENVKTSANTIGFYNEAPTGRFTCFIYDGVNVAELEVDAKTDRYMTTFGTIVIPKAVVRKMHHVNPKVHSDFITIKGKVYKVGEHVSCADYAKEYENPRGIVVHAIKERAIGGWI